MLDNGDGTICDAYAEATGVTPLPSMMEPYRIRWDLADIAISVRRLRRAHTGSLDDDRRWDIISAVIMRPAPGEHPVPATIHHPRKLTTHSHLVGTRTVHPIPTH